MSDNFSSSRGGDPDRTCGSECRQRTRAPWQSPRQLQMSSDVRYLGGAAERGTNEMSPTHLRSRRVVLGSAALTAVVGMSALAGCGSSTANDAGAGTPNGSGQFSGQ